jgi:hypothetical protein
MIKIMIIAKISSKPFASENQLSKKVVVSHLFTYLFSASVKALWLEATHHYESIYCSAQRLLYDKLMNIKHRGKKYQIGTPSHLNRKKEVHDLDHYTENIAAFP